MLGARVGNAAGHAGGKVRIGGRRDGEDVGLAVEDDGPGMTEEAVARATQRGVRIDETGNGHGFGLAIVRDLAEAPETGFRLGRSPLRGPAAELRWAGAEADRPCIPRPNRPASALSTGPRHSSR